MTPPLKKMVIYILWVGVFVGVDGGCAPVSTDDKSALSGDQRVVGKPYIEWLRKEPANYEDSPKTLQPIGIKMVFIPGGRFSFAGPPNTTKRGGEGPGIDMQVEPFWMAQFEMTNDAFAVFEGRASGSDRELIWRFRNEHNPLVTEAMLRAAPFGGEMPGAWIFAPIQRSDIRTADLSDRDPARFPVRGVSQYSAMWFCRWLSLRSGRIYRLPTEVEWEYAARAGSKTAYFWGDEPTKASTYAWFKDDHSNKPKEVGLKKPNPWGLSDIYGNLGEWVLDGWSDDYTAKELDPVFGLWRRRSISSLEVQDCVVRGGDFTSSANDLRSTSRIRVKDISLDGEIPAYYVMTDEGLRVTFRIISPVRQDKDRHRIDPKMSWQHDYYDWKFPGE